MAGRTVPIPEPDAGSQGRSLGPALSRPFWPIHDVTRAYNRAPEYIPTDWATVIGGTTTADA